MQGGRIVVTGGAGFIGVNLVQRLLDRGNEVICVDDLSTGSPGHVARFEGRRGYHFLRQDVAELLAVDGAVDRVWNLACPASPIQYRRLPVHTTRTAVVGTLNALELARAKGARLIQASTSEVYGDPAVHPQTEGYTGNTSPTGPRACYNEGKRCAEALCFDHIREYGMGVRVARIFNTYGPGMRPDDGRVVPDFLRRAMADEPLHVFGDGLQTRSFCHVDDLLDGMEALMDHDGPVPGPVNLGMPDEVTMLELAGQVIGATGSRSAVVHVAAAADDPRRRCPDIGLARRLLGWAPRIPLAEGLSRMLAGLDG